MNKDLFYVIEFIEEFYFLICLITQINHKILQKYFYVVLIEFKFVFARIAS